MAYIAGYPTQPPSTQSSVLGAANPPFAGAPAGTPYLSQILQPLPDPTVLKSQYDALFPQQAEMGPTFYADQAASYLAGLPQVPQIQIPTVAPVQVAFPQGGYQQLAAAQYQGQFLPVQRELALREAQQTEALQAQLAQTGLADSGTGVGQLQNVSREFSEQLGAASSAIAGQAQARALEAQLTVATQQANVDIQRNLANAQLSYATQNANARNILEQGAQMGAAYVQALGFDAQRVDDIRANFLSFVDTQTRAALGQSEIARAALADIFSALLHEEALDMRAKEIALGYARLESEEGVAADQLALQQEQLISQADYQNRGLALEGAKLVSGINPGATSLSAYPAFAQNLANAGIAAPAASTLGGFGFGMIGA